MKFYELAAQDKKKEMRDIFMQMASRGREHENTFRDMLAHVGSYISENPLEDYEYIKGIVDAHIFAGERIQQLVTKGTMTDIEAVEAGIGLEKDSILFYPGMRGMVPNQDSDIIRMITSEKKKHLSELMYMANKLRSN